MTSHLLTWRVPPEARSVGREWLQLATSAPSLIRFDPVMIAGLPVPAQRWLTHAITPGNAALPDG